MPLGSALPSPLFHVPNVGVEYFVSTDGSDSTGTGSEGAPWLTPQHAADYLRLTATWPTNQDVNVRLLPGTYQAAANRTLELEFVAGSRSPSSTRWLLWESDDPADLAIIENPDTQATNAYGIQINNTSGCRYMSFRNLHIYGGDERRGLASGNGSSVGFFTSGNSNHHIEIVGCEIDGFQGRGPLFASAQALLLAGDTALGVKVGYNHIHDIGTNTITAPNNEHGMYVQTLNTLVINNLTESLPNGYSAQFYAGAGGDQAQVIGNTFVDARASGTVIDDSGSGILFKNNAFVGHTGRGADSVGIEFFPPGSSGTGNLVDHNLYYNNSGGNRSSSPSGWAFTNEIAANPHWDSAYRPLTSSPLYAAGDPDYVPATDLDGNLRVAATIGAFAAPEELAAGDFESASDLFGFGHLDATGEGGIDVGIAALLGFGLLSAESVHEHIATAGSGRQGFIDLPEYGRVALPTVGQLAHTRRG